MRSELRTSTVWISFAIVACLTLGACFNGHNAKNTHYGGTNRLQLLIEANRTDVAGTHFLVDSATGDLWRLDAGGSDPGRWVRLADGPTDLQELDPEHGFPPAEELEGDAS